MTSKRFTCCTVLSLGLALGTCFVGCGEGFETGELGAAGAPGGASGEGGELGGTGGSSTGGSSTGGTATEQGGAPESAGGGSDAVAGSPGAGGEPTTATDLYRDAIMADHPLVYWRMGKVSAAAVPDETGGGNALVLQGTGHQLGVSGAVKGDDAAMGFDGESSFAIASDARALDFTEVAAFTLECWARRETGGASYFQHLISNVDGVANNRDGYVLYLLPEPAAGEAPRSVFERDRPANDVGIFGPVGKVSAWAHYAAVFDGVTATLYVNGTLASTGMAPGNIASRKTPFAVARATNGANFFKGALDEIAVYPRALDAAAIAKHVVLAK
jgi:hypothetical protein